MMEHSGGCSRRTCSLGATAASSALNSPRLIFFDFARREIWSDLARRLIDSGFDTVDYAELRQGDNLVPATVAAPGTRLFVAARIGGTRLIDNMAVD